MQNVPTKTDTVSTLPAAEFNNFMDELENLITTLGVALDAGSVVQLSQAVAAYASIGDYYTESGSANTYVTTESPAGRKVPSQYFTGMRVRFTAGNANTGASTINVASLGVKNIKKADGTTDPASGDIKTDGLTILWYDGTVFRIHSSGQATNVDSAINGSATNFQAKSNVTTPDEKVDVSFDAIVLENSTGGKKEFASGSFTVDIVASGANGRASGVSSAADTHFPIWIIGKEDGTVAGLLGPAAGTVPTLPAGYTYRALKSNAHTDATSDFLEFKDNGDQYWYDLPIVFQSGDPGTTYIEKDLDAYIPTFISNVPILGVFSSSSGGRKIAADASVPGLRELDMNGLWTAAPFPYQCDHENSVWVKWTSASGSGTYYVYGYIKNKLNG